MATTIIEEKSAAEDNGGACIAAHGTVEAVQNAANRFITAMESWDRMEYEHKRSASKRYKGYSYDKAMQNALNSLVAHGVLESHGAIGQSFCKKIHAEMIAGQEERDESSTPVIIPFLKIRVRRWKDADEQAVLAAERMRGAMSGAAASDGTYDDSCVPAENSVPEDGISQDDMPTGNLTEAAAAIPSMMDRAADIEPVNGEAEDTVPSAIAEAGQSFTDRFMPVGVGGAESGLMDPEKENDSGQAVVPETDTSDGDAAGNASNISPDDGALPGNAASIAEQMSREIISESEGIKESIIAAAKRIQDKE